MDDSASDFSRVCGFLEAIGAGRVFHHGTTLLVHLRNVWRVLLAWECAPEVCLAGLCHSLYCSLVSANPDGRRQLAKQIGVPAEILVYMIAVIPREQVNQIVMGSAIFSLRAGGTHAGDNIAAITAILVANDLALLGHCSLSQRVLERTRCFASDSLHLLPVRARADVAKLYRLEGCDDANSCAIARASYAAAYKCGGTRKYDPDDIYLLRGLEKVLPERALILDAGCGLPVEFHSAGAFRTVGLNAAIDQTLLAIGDTAVFLPLRTDLCLLPFRAEAFDGICFFYALDNIPRARQSVAMGEVYRVLKPEGWALLCLGGSDIPARIAAGFPSQSIGSSSNDADENLAMLCELGFRVHWSRIVGDASSRNLFVMAQKVEKPEMLESVPIAPHDRITLERFIYPSVSSARDAIRNLYRDQWPVLTARDAHQTSFSLCDHLAISPHRDNHLQEVLRSVFGLTLPEAAGYFEMERLTSGTFLITLQHTWALMNFAVWIRDHQAAGAIPTILHIDSHDDLQPPSILTSGDHRVFRAPLGVDVMDLTDPSTVQPFIERGFVGIGGFLTPAFHAIRDCHFVHLHPPTGNAPSMRRANLELTVARLPYFGGNGEQPIARVVTDGESMHNTVPVLFASNTTAIPALPGSGPVLVDIDMDYFCNHFDDSTLRPPPIFTVSDIIRRMADIGAWLHGALSGRPVELVNLAFSPGFYPAALWEGTLPAARNWGRSLLQTLRTRRATS